PGTAASARSSTTTDHSRKRPVGSLPPSKPPTGPAPPGARSARREGRRQPTAGHTREGGDHVVPLVTHVPEVPVTGRTGPAVPPPPPRPAAPGRGLGGPQPAVGHRRTGAG